MFGLTHEAKCGDIFLFCFVFSLNVTPAHMFLLSPDIYFNSQFLFSDNGKVWERRSKATRWKATALFLLCHKTKTVTYIFLKASNIYSFLNRFHITPRRPASSTNPLPHQASIQKVSREELAHRWRYLMERMILRHIGTAPSGKTLVSLLNFSEKHCKYFFKYHWN